MAETLITFAPRHTERAVRGTTVLELRGEIDILTAPPLGARLDDLRAVVLPDLVVGLRAVYGRLRLVTLRIHFGAGLDGVFEMYDHLPEVLAAVPGGVLTATAG
ncbi:STAS domain-containing protein [Streptomyces sp. NPDC003233]